MTSWGCPFDCTFCSVTAMFGRKYRFRSAESVIAELKDEAARSASSSTTTTSPPTSKRLKTLLRMMIDEGLVMPWSAPGAHRRGPRPGAARPHAALRLRPRRTSASSRSTRRRWTASRSRRPSTTSSSAITVAARLRHQEPRHVRAGRRHRRRADRARHGRRSPSSTTSTRVMLNILTPLPGTQQFDELDAAGPHLRQALGALRRPARGLHAAAHDARTSCRPRTLRGYTRFYSLRTWLATCSRSSSPSSCCSTGGAW